ncbi:MAG: DNA/RNA non-specific endonuclease [Gammaproteobacteria bacterium]
MSKTFAFRFFRWLFRRPAGWLLMAVVSFGVYALEVQLRERMVYGGVPKAQGWEPGTFARVFRNEGYMVGYSEWRASPLWVSYRLEAVRVPKRYRRPSSFSIDNRSLRRIDHGDYSHSGYDRGHLAPNYAISQVHGRKAQHETFLMTNVVPQRPDLNQVLWQRLEEVAIKHLAAAGPVWVLTGPVFGESPKQLESGVAVPDAFFKIFIRPASEPGSDPMTLSFLVPQNVNGNEDLRRFVTSIDAVEAATALDFLPGLDDWVEERVEARGGHAGWKLGPVATLPGRYARH